MATASGTIYRSGGKERIGYATVKAYKQGPPLYTTADQNGNFSITLPESGNWTLVALDADSYASKPMQIEMDQDQKDIKIYQDRISDTADDRTGKMFFSILLGVLGGLITLYLFAHLVFFNTGKGFEIWSTDPLRYLEIILWGLAGILVSKIITTGFWIRSHRFYREGMLMHVAHIVATPILVLVLVLLLAQVSLKFTLANSNEITLDLSVPTIMVAFAFIIGTSPWPLWNFIVNTAKRFTGQLDKNP